MRVRIWVSAAVALCAGLLLCTQVVRPLRPGESGAYGDYATVDVEDQFSQCGHPGRVFQFGRGLRAVSVLPVQPRGRWLLRFQPAYWYGAVPTPRPIRIRYAQATGCGR